MKLGCRSLFCHVVDSLLDLHSVIEGIENADQWVENADQRVENADQRALTSCCSCGTLLQSLGSTDQESYRAI